MHFSTILTNLLIIYTFIMYTDLLIMIYTFIMYNEELSQCLFLHSLFGCFPQKNWSILNHELVGTRTKTNMSKFQFFGFINMSSLYKSTKVYNYMYFSTILIDWSIIYTFIMKSNPSAVFHIFYFAILQTKMVITWVIKLKIYWVTFKII